MSDRDLDSPILQEIASYRAEYQRRGFQGRIGFGSSPAVLHIDIMNAYTNPGTSFSCRNTDAVVENCLKLNKAARSFGIPIIYARVEYTPVEAISNLPSEMEDAGLWAAKLPLWKLAHGTATVSLDPRLDVGPDDRVIVKKRASAFFNTNLKEVLRSEQIDTLILTGFTASGCVRNTAEDAMAEGFRPIVVDEAVGDRMAAVREWSLFDMDAKFADVETVDHVIESIGRIS